VFFAHKQSISKKEDAVGKKTRKLEMSSKTFITFRGIESQAKDFMIRKMLKELARLQDRVDMKDALIRQNDANFMFLQQEQREKIANLNDGFDKRLEHIIDHLTLSETESLKKIESILKSITGRPTKATLLATTTAIHNLIQERMDEINAGTDMPMEK